MNRKSIVFISMAVSMLLITGVFGFAQDMQMQQQQQEIPEVSDQELENFVGAYEVVQEMQQGINQEINQLVEESSLSQNEFQQMYQSQTTNNQAALPDVSDEKKQSFLELMNEINGKQQTLQQEMVSEIEDFDLTVQRFNNIIAAIQQDSELYEKFQEMATN